jgi:hypothetical protein
MSTANFPLPRENAGEKEGYLKKQSDFFKSWNQRYCILKGNTIYYFKTDTVSRPMLDGRVTERRSSVGSAPLSPAGGAPCLSRRLNHPPYSVCPNAALDLPSRPRHVCAPHSQSLFFERSL